MSLPQVNRELVDFEAEEKASVSISNSNQASIWDEDHTSLFDPSPLKSILFNGTPHHQKSEDELMQHYFEQWKGSQKRYSGETSNSSSSQAVISKDRFRRMYTIPFADQNDNPLQASQLSVKSVANNEEFPSFSLVQKSAAVPATTNDQGKHSRKVVGAIPERNFESSKGDERTGKANTSTSKGDVLLSKSEDSTSPRFSLTQAGAPSKTLADGTPRVSAATAVEETGRKKVVKNSEVSDMPSNDASKSLVGTAGDPKVASDKDKLVSDKKQSSAMATKPMADGTPRVSVETAVEEAVKKPILKISDSAAKSLPDVSKALSSSSKDAMPSREGPSASSKEKVGYDRKQAISPRSAFDQPLQNLPDSNQSVHLKESFPKSENSVQTLVEMPANSAPQLVDRGQHELVLTWDPWIVTNTKSKLPSSSIEYSLDWKEGKGSGGQWNSIPAVLKTCETRKRNLTPSTWYSFRVRARLVNQFLKF
jgi:hypothetical protein